VLTVIVHLSAALARRGHQVDLWQLHEWASDSYADQLAVLDSSGVHRVAVPVNGPVWQLGRAARTLAGRSGVDLVHLHGGYNPSNTAISRSLQCPYVFSPHSAYDPVSLRRSRTRKVLYGPLFERRMLKRAALIVGLTDLEVAQIRAFGVRGRVRTISNGVRAPHADIDRLAFRRDLKIPDDDGLVAFVGRLDVYRKGLDLLVSGISEAPRWHLALVGPAFRDVDRLERMIVELGIAERLHLTGERRGRRLQEALAGADLFALLSRWEGLPMALLESMSYGVPAAVGPAVRRIIDVEEAGAGWVVQDGALGPLLRTLTDQGAPELRARGEAARVLASRYDWNTVAEQYEAAYEEVLRSTESVM
jgi:glycosyltransferase involved in cell wall biosynthesis